MKFVLDKLSACIKAVRTHGEHYIQMCDNTDFFASCDVVVQAYSGVNREIGAVRLSDKKNTP